MEQFTIFGSMGTFKNPVEICVIYTVCPICSAQNWYLWNCKRYGKVWVSKVVL